VSKRRHGGLAFEAVDGDRTRYAVLRHPTASAQDQAHQLQCGRLQQAGRHRFLKAGAERLDVDQVKGLGVWQSHDVS
jgi:hypothetical protein